MATGFSSTLVVARCGFDRATYRGLDADDRSRESFFYPAGAESFGRVDHGT
jgi:hypothetical protein